jgi:hypothetical protein
MIAQVTGPERNGLNPVADNLLAIPYSLFFAMWSVTFLSSWTQRQNELRFLWGSEDFEVGERTRPEFKGQVLTSPGTILALLRPSRTVLRPSMLASCCLRLRCPECCLRFSAPGQPGNGP